MARDNQLRWLNLLKYQIFTWQINIVGKTTVLCSSHMFHCERIIEIRNGPLFTYGQFLASNTVAAHVWSAVSSLLLWRHLTLLWSLPSFLISPWPFSVYRLCTLLHFSIAIMFDFVHFSTLLCLIAVSFRFLPLWVTSLTNLLSSFRPLS